MMRDITQRRRVPGGCVIRTYECGHEEDQKSGVQAKHAERGWCSVCSGGAKFHEGPKKVGPCMARSIFKASGRCGAPGVALKDGEPRCFRHKSSGSKTV